MGFLLLAFLIFSGAFLAAGYMVWAAPERRQAELLAGRLREVRAHVGARTRPSADLIRREQRGTFAFLSDFVSWIGVLRRLQEYIDQADLKYRAVDVFTLAVILAASKNDLRLLSQQSSGTIPPVALMLSSEE